MSSAPIPPLNEPPPTVNDYWLEKPLPMPVTPGLHRINWNIRHDSPPAFTHSYEINANPFLTPASPGFTSGGLPVNTINPSGQIDLKSSTALEYSAGAVPKTPPGNFR